MVRNPGGLLPEVLKMAERHCFLVQESLPEVSLLVYCTLRTPEEQAVLYGKGRSRSKVDSKIAELEVGGYKASARLLREFAVPSAGAIVTCSAPYLSFHQWRLAYDCVPLLHGKPLWSAKGVGSEIWDTVSSTGKSLGLEWAGDWETFKELFHFQHVPTGFNLKDEARKVP